MEKQGFLPSEQRRGETWASVEAEQGERKPSCNPLANPKAVFIGWRACVCVGQGCLLLRMSVS